MNTETALAPTDLTYLQERFCLAYVGEANGNGVKAAQLAGYAGDKDELASRASQLLRIAKVQARLRELVTAYAIDQIRALQIVSDIAQGNTHDLVGQLESGHPLTAINSGLIKRIVITAGKIDSTSIELYDRLDAAKTILKIYGMLDRKDKTVEHHHTGHIAIGRVYDAPLIPPPAMTEPTDTVAGEYTELTTSEDLRQTPPTVDNEDLSTTSA